MTNHNTHSADSTTQNFEKYKAEFRDYIISQGFAPPHLDAIELGETARFSTKADNTSDKSGWLIFKGFIGFFGDNRHQETKQFWKAKRENLSQAQRKAQETMVKETEKENSEQVNKKQLEAQAEAEAILASGTTKGVSEYLSSKQVDACGLIFNQDEHGAYTGVPLRDLEGTLWNIQKLYSKKLDGSNNKWFLKDGRKKGCFHLIGAAITELQNHSRVFVCEGYATGASIHMATGEPVIIAFDAGNLVTVCGLLKDSQFTNVVLAPDDDALKNSKRNEGLIAARKIQKKCGFTYIKPVFNKDLYSTLPSDFNDIHVVEGLERVAEILKKKNALVLIDHVNPNNSEEEYVWNDNETCSYKILGVASYATDKEIKQAYHIRSKQFHPDLNPNDSKASFRFKKIHTAYETLRTPGKRAKYDKRMHEEDEASNFEEAGQDNDCPDIDYDLLYKSFPEGHFNSATREDFKRTILVYPSSKTNFYGTGKQIASRVSKDMLEKYKGHIIFDGSDYWGFNEKFWQKLSHNKEYSEITGWALEYDNIPYFLKVSKKEDLNTTKVIVRIKLTKSDISLIHDVIKSQFVDTEFFKVSKSLGIPCFNGFLEFSRNGEIRLNKHDQKFKNKHIIDVECDEKWATDDFVLSSNSLIYQLLKGSFKELPEDEFNKLITLFCQILGSVASGAGRDLGLISPCAFFLIGEKANNGKSQFLEILTNFVHEDYISSIQPEGFKNKNNTFDLYYLKDKLLNYTNEIADAGVISSDIWKSIVTHEGVSARDLFKSNIRYYPNATHFLAGNQMPVFKGGWDKGVQRRSYAIYFERVIPKEERIPNISKKIIKEEMPLLLRMAAYGLSSLLQSKDYIRINHFEKRFEDHITQADPLLAWFAECINVTGISTDRISSREAYKHFQNWATTVANYFHVIGEILFTQRIKGIDDPRIKYYHSGNFRGFTGIKLGTVPSPPPSSSVPLTSQLLGGASAHPAQTAISIVQGECRILQPSEVQYKFIEFPKEALQEVTKMVDEALANGITLGIDLETTGLNPHEGAKARLLQLSNGTETIVVDLFKTGGLEAFAEPLSRIKAVAHNAVFEMKFLKVAGIEVVLDCTMIAVHTICMDFAKQKGRLTLQGLVHLCFEIVLDKQQQASDWTGNLTPEQIKYAALDAYYTKHLWEGLKEDLLKTHTDQGYINTRDAQQAIVDIELTGMPFDKVTHESLISKLKAKEADLLGKLQVAIPDVKNFNSGKQLTVWMIKQFNNPDDVNKWERTKGNDLITDQKYLKNHLHLLKPEAQEILNNLYIPYREIEKKLNTYGETFSKDYISQGTGRIHSQILLCGTKTGRTSSNEPNIQQTPRDNEFRSLYKPNAGRKLVIADYSQIELRIAAIYVNETTLLKAYEDGVDTHKLTASLLLHKTIEEVTKPERQMAKAVNFGLLYGQKPHGLKDSAKTSYGVDMTIEDAARFSKQWFEHYPAFKVWHDKSSIKPWQANVSISTQLGRTLNFHAKVGENGENGKWLRDTQGKVIWQIEEGYHYWNQNTYLNTPIQGTGADLLLRAIGQLHEKLKPFEAHLVMIVHDEIIVEVDEQHAEKVKDILEQTMIEAFTFIYPKACTKALVEATIANSWGDK